MTTKNPQPAVSQLEEKLHNVQVGVRADLETSRHQFRGQIKYVILDPITFQTHALNQFEYEILVRIQESRPLGAVFESAVEEGLFSPDQAEPFYEFVLTLHQAGFLTLPIVDDQALYRRFEQKRQRARRELLMAFISYRVPLFDPDRFLDRTIRLARPIFSRWFFVLWLIFIGSALGLVIQRIDEFAATLPSLIEARSLLSIWIVLIALKVLHEFGHAYACKHFGGKVPEMGAYFILMTPCAYVNATASWGFPSKFQRMIVSLAGMYVELFFAAAAAFVWLSTGPSFLNTLAFQAMVVASVTTIGFNINPLMRFDGYYIFSDLVEIPNLRSRAAAYVNRHAGHLLIGIKKQPLEMSRGMKAILLLYGTAAFIYRIFLIFSISLLLILKFSLVGFAMAGIYVGIQILQNLKRATSFFQHRNHSLSTRLRAALLCAGVAIGLPAILIGIPFPRSMTMTGKIEPESYQVITAASPGVVKTINVNLGQTVTAQDIIVELDNPESETALIEAESEKALADLKHQLALVSRSGESFSIQEEVTFRQKVADARARDLQDLLVTTEHAGLVLDCLQPENIGRLVQPGEAIALIGSGRAIATIHLTEEEALLIEPQPGDFVEYRFAFDPDTIRTSQILSVGQIASRETAEDMIYAINEDPRKTPETLLQPNQPEFEITILLDDQRALQHYAGGTILVRMQAPNESVAQRLYRRTLLFVSRLRRG